MRRSTARRVKTRNNIWLLSVITGKRLANVPWTITSYLANRAVGFQATSKIGGGHWVTRIIKNLGLFILSEIKKCKELKSGVLDEKSYAWLIDKNTIELLPIEERVEQVIEHEEEQAREGQEESAHD